MALSVVVVVVVVAVAVDVDVPHPLRLQGEMVSHPQADPEQWGGFHNA